MLCLHLEHHIDQALKQTGEEVGIIPILISPKRHLNARRRYLTGCYGDRDGQLLMTIGLLYCFPLPSSCRPPVHTLLSAVIAAALEDFSRHDRHLIKDECPPRLPVRLTRVAPTCGRRQWRQRRSDVTSSRRLDACSQKVLASSWLPGDCQIGGGHARNASWDSQGTLQFRERGWGGV